jgi:murein DD-endopeptidase MepM/ murein hydrolase activator NlpD
MFSDNQSGKSAKGFYAALGISAVMIGSACYFAYKEGEKLSDSSNLTISSQDENEAVDKKYTDVPKVTAAVTTTVATSTTTTVTTTVAPVVNPVTATIPAAAVIEVVPSDTETDDVITDVLENTSVSTAGFVSPLSDVSNIINPFSGTELVKNATTGSWQTHNGTDIAVETGTDVFAVYTGEITAINDDPLWGVTVVIDHHNGYITKYCSLAKDLSVQEGDTVVSGDIIGVTGDTADIESGLSPHLHIEITRNGDYQNPVSVINALE